MSIFQIALDHLKRRKIKTTFLMVGLLIGVATVVALMSIIQAMRLELGNELDKFGPNIVIIPRFNGQEMYYGSSLVTNVAFDVRPLTESDLLKIRSIPDRESINIISPKLVGSVTLNDRQALLVGVEMAEQATATGVDALAAGDMGIGNTTPAAALASVFTGKPVAAVTGRGTGIDDPVWRHKMAVINRALALHRPSPEDPVGALAAVGGLEIAGIAGFILGTAAARRPLLLDGFIATAGALVATALAPAATEYLIAAHRSVEPGHQLMLDFLGLKPLLNFQMRLGEGTGAALGLTLLEAGVRIYREMATFGEAGVADQEA